ncbi:MAG: tetraacyldisaccharide 4'-kinase [Paludibacteraceae bacterium]|nr:tetraacyldisaccharide 4'-kinase [Paludibacteraceae bacterium]
MKWYNVLSAPIAWLYGFAVFIRNLLYKTQLLHSHRVSVPTICVGNLAVGGTGKTPFVEYLIRMLGKDYKVAVLSRGYRRKTHGFVLADNTSTAFTIGDEPMQIHYKFPHIPVAVCADRIYGIRRLQTLHPEIQVILLDDAFQYRRLTCGFYILLTAYDNLYIDDHFLPMGHLRDSRLECSRASAIVVTKCPPTMTPIQQRIVDTKLHLPAFQQLAFSSIDYPAVPQNQRILLVTGIANPEYLFSHICKVCPSAQLMSFGDHHVFTNKELQKIDTVAANFDVVLTTEKDYMRFLALPLPETLSAKLSPLPITIQVMDDSNLERQLRQYINESLHLEK